MAEYPSLCVRRILCALAVLGVFVCESTAWPERWPKAELPLTLPSSLIVDAVKGSQNSRLFVKPGNVSAPLLNDGSNSLDAGTWLAPANALMYHWARWHGPTERGAQAGTELIVFSPGPITPHRRCVIDTSTSIAADDGSVWLGPMSPKPGLK